MNGWPPDRLIRLRTTKSLAFAARAPAFARQALHAYKLAFNHPDDGAAMRFEIALPEDMRALIDGLTGR